MEVETKVRKVRSLQSLGRLLDAILAGEADRPDWIELQGKCRLDALPKAELAAILERLHRAVRRGFRTPDVGPRGSKAQLRFWRRIAQSGFHDFSELGWSKAYDSPWVENYDYLAPYLEGGLEALDPYAVYSAVLGTHDYGVEDFVNTKLCGAVETVVEPMAGSAEFVYQGHFRYPDFRYVMFDLDPEARARVLRRRWLPNVEHHYTVADVLDSAVWAQVKSLTSGQSLCYVGKQSHHYFGPKELRKLLQLATEHTDYFMVEAAQVALVSEMDERDDLTRPEMKAAGFRAALVNEPNGAPNPLTNEMSFRLELSDRKRRRTLFRYRDWTNWHPPSLVALARLLDLEVFYYHAEEHEFLPVGKGTSTCDCHDNVTFMVFTRARRAMAPAPSAR